MILLLCQNSLMREQLIEYLAPLSFKIIIASCSSLNENQASFKESSAIYYCLNPEKLVKIKALICVSYLEDKDYLTQELKLWINALLLASKSPKLIMLNYTQQLINFNDTEIEIIRGNAEGLHSIIIDLEYPELASKTEVLLKSIQQFLSQQTNFTHRRISI